MLGESKGMERYNTKITGGFKKWERIKFVCDNKLNVWNAGEILADTKCDKSTNRS